MKALGGAVRLVSGGCMAVLRLTSCARVACAEWRLRSCVGKWGAQHGWERHAARESVMDMKDVTRMTLRSYY